MKNSMKNSITTIALLFTFLGVAGSGVAAELTIPANPVPGRYIVAFKPGVALRAEGVFGQSVADHARGLIQQHGGQISKTWDHALEGFLLLGDERVARAVAKDSRVEYVYQDSYVRLDAIQATPHWGLDRIDERDRPLNNHFTYGATGAGVNIYIIDSGISADPEFGTRKVDAFSTVLEGGVVQHGDCNGHGTNVAKLAGGGTAGVAKGAKLYAVRVGAACSSECQSGHGSYDPKSDAPGACDFRTADVISGMDWITANRVKPAVANMSISGAVSVPLDDAARRMHNAGVTVVLSAGNGGIDACGVSPARLPEAITVGASDINDARAVYDASSSSNTGTCIDLFAPGKDVNNFGGTSAAAPLVAGAAALYLQGNPTATPATVRNYVVNNATSSRLTGIGTSPNRLLFITPGGTESDATPVANFSCSCNGTKTCSFFGASTDDFALKSCRYTVGYDSFNRPIYRYGCGTVSYTYAYTGPYQVDLVVTDDGNQNSAPVNRVCQ